MFNAGAVHCDNEINLFAMIMISMRVNVWFFYIESMICMWAWTAFVLVSEIPKSFQIHLQTSPSRTFSTLSVLFMARKRNFPLCTGWKTVKLLLIPGNSDCVRKGLPTDVWDIFGTLENWGWVTAHKGITIDSYQFYWGTSKCFFNSLAFSLINSQKAREQNPLSKI